MPSMNLGKKFNYENIFVTNLITKQFTYILNMIKYLKKNY